MTQARNARYGLIGLAVLAAVGYFFYAYLSGALRASYHVEAVFERAGQNLRSGSDVKVRGVLVGSVQRTEVTRDGTARVVMAMIPGHQIPANVGAAIRAKTLFGEKFVDLRIVDAPAARILRDGDVIPIQRTVPPFEVETVLAHLVPLLNAIDPSLFAGALEALAQALVPSTGQLRKATTQGEQALIQTQPTLPNLENDLRHLQRFAAALDASDQDLVKALDGLERAGSQVVAHESDVRTVLDRLPPLTKDLADIVSARERDLGDLSSQGAALLRVVAARANEIPALVDVLDSFLGAWISDLTSNGKPTGMWRILVTTSPAIGGAYPPGTEPKPVARTGVSRILRAPLT